MTDTVTVPRTLGEVLQLKGRTFEKDGRRVYVDMFYYNVDYWTHGHAYIRPGPAEPSKQRISIESLLDWLGGANEVR